MYRYTCSSVTFSKVYRVTIARRKIRDATFAYAAVATAGVIRVNKSGKGNTALSRKENGVVALSAREKKGERNLSPLRHHFLSAVSARRMPFDNPRYAIAILVSTRMSRGFTAGMNMQYFSTPRRSYALYNCMGVSVLASVYTWTCTHTYIYISE